MTAAPAPASAAPAQKPERGPSLETIGMSKTFGALKALQDVSISVPAGSFHALLGENGAGKSTLVKCIMGFYTPDKGNHDHAIKMIKMQGGVFGAVSDSETLIKAIT